MTPCRYPPAPYDWDKEMTEIETRLDDHLTDEETAARLAEIDRLTAPLHRERVGHAILGAIGTAAFALLTVFACSVIL